MSFARAVARNPVLRRGAYLAARGAARSIVFLPAPRVLANSVPKAGTHLLSTVLAGLPRMMFSGVHHALNDFSASPGLAPEALPEVDWTRLDKALRGVNRGQFMTAHFPAAPGLPERLRDRGFRSTLMVRDPRDIVVSHTFYVTRLQRHFLHRRYNEALRDDAARFLASIRGFPADEFGAGQESIGRRMEKYLGWIDDPNCRVCRFEDLVGERGGGSAERQRAEIQALAEHVDRPLPEARVGRLVERAWSNRAATFRKGVIGDWRNHFDEAHVQAFKEVAGDVLVRLGYENDLEW